MNIDPGEFAREHYPELRGQFVPAGELIAWLFLHHEHDSAHNEEPFVYSGELDDWVRENARTLDDQPARLSRILFQARENLEMWADVVRSRAGRGDSSLAALIGEIDDYRSERGWNVDGFGGES
jgi:hypothetical protein